MKEKAFDKLVDEVTERVSFRILSADWVCYQCGERSIKERLEKLEQELTKRMRVVDGVDIVRCMDCRLFKGSGRECCMGLYVFEDDFCSVGYRREADEH